MPQLITREQTIRLQTLYGQLAAHTQEGADRASRLAWASAQTGRAIASFSELTCEEAKLLIDALQGRLGLKAAPLRKRRRLSRDAAHRAGTDGRHDSQYAAQPQIASAADLAAIENYYGRLGWTRQQFDAWLASPRSPLSARARPVVATAADANRVRWALKGMLRHRGLWEDRHAHLG